MLSFVFLVSASLSCFSSYFFFFTAPPTTEFYTLSLHDALPILPDSPLGAYTFANAVRGQSCDSMVSRAYRRARSEEHTSELQSPYDLVCRLLLEKKKDQGTRGIVGSLRNIGITNKRIVVRMTT